MSAEIRASSPPMSECRQPDCPGRLGGDSALVAAVCAHGNVILRVNSAVTLALVATPNNG